jgi:hypothetical protein
MPLQLKQYENVLYPIPYVPTEANLFVITNQRVIHYSEAGHQELPSHEIHFVGRLMVRPLQVYGLLLIMAALPLFIVAIWQFSTVWGMESAPVTALFSSADAPDPDAPPPPEGMDPSVNWPVTVLRTRILVLVLAIAGAGCALGGWKLLKRKSFYVVVRAGNRVAKVAAKDKIQQDLILATVNAVKGKTSKQA